MECTAGIMSTAIYHDYLAQIPPLSAEQRFTEKSFADQNKGQCSRSKLAKTTEDKLSVIIFGIDSMSKENMVRQMPLTLKTLERLGAVNFLNHVKVQRSSIVAFLIIF